MLSSLGPYERQQGFDPRTGRGAGSQDDEAGKRFSERKRGLRTADKAGGQQHGSRAGSWVSERCHAPVAPVDTRDCVEGLGLPTWLIADGMRIASRQHHHVACGQPQEGALSGRLEDALPFEHCVGRGCPITWQANAPRGPDVAETEVPVSKLQLIECLSDQQLARRTAGIVLRTLGCAERTRIAEHCRWPHGAWPSVKGGDQAGWGAKSRRWRPVRTTACFDIPDPRRTDGAR